MSLYNCGEMEEGFDGLIVPRPRALAINKAPEPVGTRHFITNATAGKRFCANFENVQSRRGDNLVIRRVK
jgi:hypothetical protein